MFVWSKGTRQMSIEPALQGPDGLLQTAVRPVEDFMFYYKNESSKHITFY